MAIGSRAGKAPARGIVVQSFSPFQWQLTHLKRTCCANVLPTPSSQTLQVTPIVNTLARWSLTSIYLHSNASDFLKWVL